MKKRILLSACLMAGMSLRGSVATKQSIKRAAVVAALAGAMTFGAPVNAENVYTFDPSTMGTSTNIKWTQSSAAKIAEKGYVWKHTDVVPDTTNMVPVLDGTKLQSASGALRFNLPHNGTTQTQYYIYEYTNPNKAYESLAHMGNLVADITEAEHAYFYNQSDSNGGAIYNTSSAGYNITADFIGNSALDQYGGAIWINWGTIGTLTGDFIGNTAKDGGAIKNNKGTITTLTGDFIGNSALASGGGAIDNYSGTIGTITGDFIGNTAKFGGAIYNYLGTIGTITGDFIGNTATNSGGGAICNYSGTIGTITGDFIGNTAINRSGGAIWNNQANGIGLVNNRFINNYAQTSGGTAQGGAIYTSQNLTITADNGTTLFQGNTANGESNAIYMDKANGTLTFDIKNGGSAYMYDVIAGHTNGYNVVIKNTGNADSTGTFYMYNDMTNANVTTKTTGNKINIDLSNDATSNVSMRTLSSDNTALYKIDFDGSPTSSADTITTTTASSGTVYINDINFYGLTGNEQEGYTQTARILNTPNSNLQLGINNTLTSDLTLYSDTVSVVDDIVPNVRWNQEFGGYDDTITLKGGFNLDTTSTTNDSLTMTITDKTESKVWTDKYDTLKAWAEQTTTEDRNFNFYVNPSDTPSAKEYVVTKDLSTATAGDMNINGEVDTEGNILSTINAQDTDSVKHQLFTITDGTTLTINNVEIKNAKTDTAAIDNQSGIVNLNNVTFTGNTTDVNNDNELNITGGTVTINNGITGTGTTNISGKLVNNSTIQQNEIAITSTGELTSPQDKLVTPNNTIKNDGTFSFNEDVVTLNVTKNTLGTGTVNLNSANTNINSTISDNTVEFNGSLLTFSDPANNIANSNLTMNNGGVINLQNGTTEELGMQNLTLKADTLINMDSDITKGTMDSLKLSSFTNDSDNTLIINPNLPTNISTALTNDKIQMSPISDDSTLSDSDKTLLASSIDMVMPDKIVSPIYIYKPSYDSETGMMTLAGGSDGGGYNPAVLAAPVAAQAGAMASQWNSYDQAFMNMDMNMLFTREARRAMKLQNKFASVATPKVFSETYLPERDMAAWARPYTSFETVHLRKGPHVNNTMYGMYLGGDSEMYELKHNWDFQYSVYAGYNGSRQSYSDVTILQNGGTLGATGIFYHGDFFTGLTVNVGAGVANADTMYGHEDFAMLMTGVGSKTGYNWELAKGRFIIQPSWLMSYSFVNTFDYTNAAGVKISSDPIHAIQLAPQLKFIGNLPHGWQPYASVQMVWNIMDESRFKANDVSLPNMSMGPFIQYGVGVQKRWGDRFTGFFQTMFRNGSRTGVAFTLGFRWALGKDTPKTSTTTQKAVIK